MLRCCVISGGPSPQREVITSTATEAFSMRVRAWCAVAGTHKRRANTGEGGDDEYLGLCSSDSEENGIALGNAPGARGTFPTPAPTCSHGSAAHMEQHRKACAQEKDEVQGFKCCRC